MVESGPELAKNTTIYFNDFFGLSKDKRIGPYELTKRDEGCTVSGVRNCEGKSGTKHVTGLCAA